MAYFEEPHITNRDFCPVAPGIWRAVANNPGKMTYRGTNTYLVDTPDGRYLLDPGPSSDDVHFSRLRTALSDRPAGIIVSHHHSDHFGAAERLQQATSLPILAHAQFADDTFRPDVALNEGDLVGDLRVLHTPGHASDHICLARADGTIFTGDLVMSWSSSIVRLPDGDMGAYVAQLKRMIEREDRLYLPGHGPPLHQPIPYVKSLLENRLRREREILQAISIAPESTAHLAANLYGKADPDLAWAAERNVEAHLDKLQQDGRAWQSEGLWRAHPGHIAK